MTSLTSLFPGGIAGVTWPSVWVECLVKGTAVLAACLVVNRVWRRASAAARHRVWMAGLLGAMAWPALALILPVRGPGLELAPLPLGGFGDPLDSVGDAALARAERSEAIPGVGGALAAFPGRQRVRALLERMPPWVAPVWLGGVAWMLVRSGVGRWRLGTLRRRSTVPADPAWEGLLSEAARRVGCRRAVALRETVEDRIPTTFGAWRPVVLVPSGASRWSLERRVLVLAHELGHVRRWDCLSLAVAEVVCAVNWFNPLAWFAAHRLRVEREHACDDLVLGAGWKGSDYASHLLDLVEGFQGAPAAGSVAIGHPSRVESRVAAMLDEGRPRWTPGAGSALLLAAGVLLIGGTWPRLLALPAAAVPEPAAPSAPAAALALGGDGMPAPPDVVPGAAQEGIRRLQLALEDQHRRIRDAEAELEGLRQNLEGVGSGPDQVGGGGVPATSRASRIHELRASVDAERTRGQATLERLRKMDDEAIPGVLLTILPGERLLPHLSLMQADAELELEALRGVVAEEHPDFRRARSRVDLIGRKIRDRVRGIMEGLQAQQAAHEEELALLDSEEKKAAARDREHSKAAEEYFAAKRRLENARLHADILSRKLAQERFDAAIPRRGPDPLSP